MTSPLVSINIRIYNSAKTLKETFDSIKTQTYKNIEVVAADGFSEDDSVSIAKSFGARVYFADKLGDARKLNYEKSRGKYLLSLDSDQVLDNNVIENCVNLCEEKGFDAVTISEKSIIQKGTLLEKLIAYDKWVIDQNKDADVFFGTACPRFFKKELFDEVEWPEGLAIFDDTILYEELLKKGAKVAYLSNYSIRHHEVSSWIVFFKKFVRYGRGYPNAFKSKPSTIAAHSLPRRSYFSKAALSKFHFFLGLLLLYGVKVIAAGSGVILYFASSLNLRSFLVTLGDLFYYQRLEEELSGMESVLDVGCGDSSPLGRLKKKFRSVGIDVFEPSIRKSKKNKIHDEYTVGDILKLGTFFKPKSFDAVIALDVIEHFNKRDALKLIDSMERIARKKVLIGTPNGFAKQSAYDGNRYQEHKSGWNVSDFKKMGYEIRGMRGFRFIRGGEGGANIQYKPWILWGVISALSQPIVFYIPQIASQLLAVKYN